MKKEKTIPQPKSKLLLFVVVLFSGFFFLYYPYLQNYSTTPKWIFGATFGLLMYFFGRKEKLQWSPGMSVWFAFILLFWIQSFWSYNFWDAIVRTVPFILAPILVLLLRREENDLNNFYLKIATAIGILILPLVLMTLVEIIALYFSGSYSHLSTYSFKYSFGHRNQYSELLVLIIPILTLGYFLNDSKLKKWIFVLSIVSIYLTVLLLQNRAAFLVMFGVYPILFSLYWIQKFNAKNRIRITWTVLLLIPLGGILLFSPLRSKIPFLQNLLETKFGSGNERLHIWKNSLDLWKESPLFGKGSGDWKIEILRTPLEYTQAEGGTVFFQRTHNDFIQVAVENGALGLLLFLLFFGIGIYLLLKSQFDRSKQLLLLGGVIGYILLSNFSFPIEKIELLVLLFLFLLPGLSLLKMKTKNFKYGAIGIVVLLIFSLGLSLKWITYEIKYFLYKKDNDQLAFSEIDKTKYTIDPTSTPLNWQEGNEMFNEKNFKAALSKYEQALEYNPYHVHVINNIGSCYYALGNIAEAENQYKKALSFNPKFTESIMNYTSLEFNRGNIDGALNLILTIPEQNEPQNYRMYVLAIAKAKYHEMMNKYDEPLFESELLETIHDDDFLFSVSRGARISGECYEVELRNQLAKMTVK